MIKENESISKMFDDIHRRQFIYRQLLDAMARPGEIKSIYDQTQLLPTPPGLTKGMIGVALTLLDREVAFYARAEKEVTDYIHWRTFSVPVPIEKADFIFVDQRINEDSLIAFAYDLKSGLFTHTRLSATLVLLVDDIRLTSEVEYSPIVLQGPGIETTRRLWIKGMSDESWEGIAMLNQEYPLGIDVIIMSRLEELFAIPRATTFERG